MTQYFKMIFMESVWALVIFPGCSRVSTTVQLHHMNSNETLWEKSRLELHKDAVCQYTGIYGKLEPIHPCRK